MGLGADLVEYGEEKASRPPLRFEPRTFQATKIRYIYYGVPAPNDYLARDNMTASRDGVFH